MLLLSFPGKNSLIRPAVANVDQAFVIFAMDNPKPNFMLLDRFLIMMEQADIPVTICFNKKDLGTREELDFLYETYQSCGYQVILSSTYQGDGMEEIKKILQGKTTVVAGPPVWGKSSITNALQGNVQMETGEISKKLKRGKHTTVIHRLFRQERILIWWILLVFPVCIFRIWRSRNLRIIFRNSGNMKGSAGFRDADISMSRAAQ